MASRLPLVIIGGQVQQIPTGDNLNVPIAQSDVRSLTNGESSSAIVCGAPVYLTAADTVKRAQANASATARAVGLMQDPSVAVGASGQVAVGGTLVLTTAQWDAVAGTSGGLAFATTYYVDPANPGKITSTAPSTVGQFVTAIGIALSTTEIEIFGASGLFVGL